MKITDEMIINYLDGELNISDKELFEEEVGKVSNELTKDKHINIDLVLSIDEINDVLYRTIMRFAPFGLENEAPIFCTNEINN